MEKREKRQGLTDFVFLEVTDEVPDESGRGGGDFLAGFLYAAFAEVDLAGRGGGGHGVDGVGFGDGHEAHGGGIASGAPGGGGDMVADELQAGGEVDHKFCL
jgi:hypothetical protein